jgi:hypothetical protein
VAPPCSRWIVCSPVRKRVAAGRSTRSLGVMETAIATLTVAALLTAAPVVAAEAAKHQRLYWPQLALSKDRGERVESIAVEITCARFRGISNIPNDWNVEVVSPSSEVSHLRASAGHGATMLWSLREWDGSIILSGSEASCFDISASVVVDIAGQTTKEYKFKRSELRIRP